MAPLRCSLFPKLRGIFSIECFVAAHRGNQPRAERPAHQQDRTAPPSPGGRTSVSAARKRSSQRVSPETQNGDDGASPSRSNAKRNAQKKTRPPKQTLPRAERPTHREKLGVPPSNQRTRPEKLGAPPTDQWTRPGKFRTPRAERPAHQKNSGCLPRTSGPTGRSSGRLPRTNGRARKSWGRLPRTKGAGA